MGFELSEIKNPEAYIFKFNKGESSFAIRKPMSNLEDKELGIGTALWFAIDEKIETLAQKLKDNEVIVLGGVNTTPFGKTLMIKDPDGYVLVFLQKHE